ncbi:MAG: hypothetical protein GY751_05160 [Bacteroidetes bacterium]|nr:hypothetical protein [Bacteroidota bacterium]
MSFFIIGAVSAQETEAVTDTNESFIPVITLNQLDEESDDEGNASSVLSVSRDAFEAVITFTLGRYRFRFRGYDSKFNTTLINYRTPTLTQH